MSRFLDIRDFGAIPAGPKTSTNEANAGANTTAIGTALAAAEPGAEVFIPHRTAFDPAVIAAPSVQLNLAVAGDIYPTGRWTVHSHTALRALGGSKGTQFQVARPARIHRPAGLTDDVATLRCTGSSCKLIGGVCVDGGSGIGIHLDDAPLTTLRGFGAYCSGGPNAIGLLIEDTFWCRLEGDWAININPLHVGTPNEVRGRAAIVFTERGRESPTNMIEMYDGVFSGAPILFERGSGGSHGGIGYVQMVSVTSETTGSLPPIRIMPGCKVFYLDLKHVYSADSKLDALIHNEGELVGFSMIGNEQLYDTGRVFKGNLPRFPVWTGPGGARIGFGPANDHPRTPFILTDNELEAVDAWRGVAAAPRPCPLEVLATPTDGASWARSLAITLAPVDGPDCRPGAWRVSCEPDAPAGWHEVRFAVAFGAPSLRDGDWLVFGVELRQDRAPVDPRRVLRDNAFWTMARSGFTLDGRTFDQPTLTYMGQHEAGWFPVVRPYRVSLTSGAPSFDFGLRLQAGDAYSVYWPFVLRADGSKWRPREVVAAASRIIRPVKGVAPGHIGLTPDQTLRLGGVGAARPDAVAVGKGAMWHDPVHGLLVSDGAAWRVVQTAPLP